MENKTAANLKAARDLLAQPGGWTTGWYAKTASGAEVSAAYEKASCFCAIGAVWRTYGNTACPDGSGVNSTEVQVLLRAIKDVTGEDWTFVHDWNDAQTSVESVLAVFDRAIELAQAEEAQSASVLGA